MPIAWQWGVPAPHLPFCDSPDRHCKCMCRYKETVDEEEADKLDRLLGSMQKKDEVQQRMEAITQLSVGAWHCTTCDIITERRKAQCQVQRLVPYSFSALISCRGMTPICDGDNVVGSAFTSSSMWILGQAG